MNGQTVAVYLGAHRSLTTISSAILALHPDVTVLNHAFIRIFDEPSRDFLRSPTPDALDAFAQAAGEMALGGSQGQIGGHILHSHAFNADAALRQAYLDRYGWGAKPDGKCLVWKDATLVTNHIRENGLDVGAVARRLPTLRFIALVRNPVDIAISSIRKGYSIALVPDEKKNDFRAVFVELLERFAWFGRLAAEQPEQFRFIFQDELLDRARLANLCDFLRISTPQSWLNDVARLISLRGSYPIPEAHKPEWRALTMQTIADAALAQRVADQIV
jgi:hypothetical protein